MNSAKARRIAENVFLCKLHAEWSFSRTAGEFIINCFLLNLKVFSVEILQRFLAARQFTSPLQCALIVCRK